jgi:acetate---CoA ligase (ADP-forming)
MSLEPLFRPRSVAVVGASRRPKSIGYEVVANLLRSGFSGPVYPVNPNADAVHSVPAWPSLDAIPGPVDLVVLTVPRDLVLPSVEAAARVGVKAIVTITAGFKEVDAEGAALEARIKDVLRESGIRMVGPNCMGLIHTDPAVNLNASFANQPPPDGSVAFASQSGALGEAILETAADLGLGLSAFVSLGNKTDVSSNDLLEWWAEDDRTRLVLLYLESLGNPRRFGQLARRLTRERGKPILAVKSGRSRAGAAAASSHTGSLAGADAGVKALFEQCGVIRANTVEQLFSLARGFAAQPLPAGRRVAILTNAGGPGIMTTDAAVHFGLELAELSESTRAAMRTVLPPEASLRNPVDTIATAGPAAFRACSEALLADPGVDALIAIYVAPVTIHAPDVAAAIVNGSQAGLARAGVAKPVLSCFMGRSAGDEGVGTLTAAGIPAWPFPEAAAEALAAMARFAEYRARPAGRIPAPKPPLDASAITSLLEGATGWLRLPDCMRVLEAAGIPVAPWAVVSNPEEAAAFGSLHGYPLVVKVDSDTVLHKSDAGGVQVDLRNERELKGAFWEIERNLADIEGDHRFVVQAMVGGVETLIGVAEDPALGHLVGFGLGGIFVELLGDVVFGVSPLTDHDADRMVKGIRGLPLLQGARGSEPADLDALVATILRVDALITAFPAIAELDLNPFFAGPSGGLAADARIRVRG